MPIWTCNAMKITHKDQLHVQHTTNAKYTKYMHLGYKILLGTSVRYSRQIRNILKAQKNATKH